MILIEFIKFVWAWFKFRKPKLKKELRYIYSLHIRYIKLFTFKKYWYENIFYKGLNVWFRILIILSFWFIIIILYQMFCFILYTIDIFITVILTYIIETFIIILEKWEEVMFKKIYEYRKDRKMSIRYKRDYAIWSKRRAKFFKNKVLKYLISDVAKGLQFKVRNYSVVIKQIKYWYKIWIFIFEWIWTSISYFFPLWWIEIKEKISGLFVGVDARKRNRRILKKVLKICLFLLSKVINFFTNIKFWILIIFRYPLRKYWIYKTIYKLKKEANNEIYYFLYNSCHIFFKRKNKVQEYFYKDVFSEAMIEEMIVFSLCFRIIHFRVIYLWHKYIRPIKYLSFLETTYNVVKKKPNTIKYLIILRDLKPFRLRVWTYILTLISKVCIFLAPPVKKYYIILNFYIRKIINDILYYIYLLYKFIITLPKFIIVYPYIPLKENIIFFIKFLKDLFNL